MCNWAAIDITASDGETIDLISEKSDCNNANCETSDANPQNK